MRLLEGVAVVCDAERDLAAEQTGGVFDEIDPDTVDMLFDIAHLIVAESLDGAVISLPDGSKMTIRDKVQRKKSVTLEAKS